MSGKIRCSHGNASSDCLKCADECAASDLEKAAHDKAWEKGFVVPIAKEMKQRGVAYMNITIRDDGKAISEGFDGAFVEDV